MERWQPGSVLLQFCWLSATKNLCLQVTSVK